MTFRVVVVDDEPAALRYVARIIDDHCPGFRTVGNGENGEEGLRALQRLRPDLLVTDAKMPILDGIQLVNRLRELGDDTPVLILSGYDDFEYVRGALNTGVVDYILKPVGVQRLKDVLEAVTPKLREMWAQKVARFVRAVAVADEEPPPPSVSEKFHLSFVRFGGLPTRRSSLGPGAHYAFGESLLIVHGHDQREWYLLASTEELDTPRYREAVTRELERLKGEAGAPSYHTVAFSTRPAKLAEFGPTLRTLRERVYRSIQPGRSRESVENPAALEPVQVGQERLERLSYAVESESLAMVRESIEELVRVWAREGTTLYQLRGAIASLLMGVSAERDQERYDEGELDGLLKSPKSYEEIGEGVRKLLLKTIQEEKEDEEELPPFYRTIREYVYRQYRLPLSLGKVADRFGLSRSYVSRLFRKYEGTSLGEFLTQRRVTVAAELLRGDRHRSVKEIATFCGFRDQYYFSRVFKASTGLSPTEYRESGP